MFVSGVYIAILIKGDCELLAVKMNLYLEVFHC